MLLTHNYQNQSILDETTACQSWFIFWDTVYISYKNWQAEMLNDKTDDTIPGSSYHTALHLSVPYNLVTQESSKFKHDGDDPSGIRN